MQGADNQTRYDGFHSLGVRFHEQHNRRGFSLLILLLALCIIGILTARQLSDFLERDRTGVSEVQRAGAAACQVNRNVLVTTINIWRMSHPDLPVTIENMRRTGQSIPACPENGVYVIGPDGTIYCSIHAPPPQPQGGVGAPGPAGGRQ